MCWRLLGDQRGWRDRLARALGLGRTIVTVLCDSGTRYQSKLFNPAFPPVQKLPVPAWLERKNTISPALVPVQ